MPVARIVYILTVCSNIFFYRRELKEIKFLTTVPSTKPDASLLPSSGHCTIFDARNLGSQFVTRHKTVYMWCLAFSCWVFSWCEYDGLVSTMCMQWQQRQSGQEQWWSGTLVSIFSVETTAMKVTCTGVGVCACGPEVWLVEAVGVCRHVIIRGICLPL